MTIAAGFRVKDGVLICADTEYSGGGLISHEPKIIEAEMRTGKHCFRFLAKISS